MTDNSDKTSAYSENTGPLKPEQDGFQETSAYGSTDGLHTFSKTHGLNVGDTINLSGNDYKIVAIVSEGTGEAVIYKVSDNENKSFALKLYYEFQNLAEEPNAETLSRIQKLNDKDILKLYHYGAGAEKFRDRFCFEISAFAEGGDLLSVANFKDTYTPEFLEKQLIPEIYKGICTLHENKIYHCDLKPGNVFYMDASQENVVIGDYGSAKAYDLESEKDVRKSSTVKGTEVYIAPEQARGIVSDKNDFYAFGMILLHLLYPEALTEGDDYSRISRKKYKSLAERQFGELPVFDFNPAYKRLNNLIEGLTLYNFTQRWSSEEVALWLEGKELPVTYKPYQTAGVPPVKLGQYTIKSENDFIHYLDNETNWYEELFEDNDTFATFRLWLDAYKDVPTRRLAVDAVKYYSPIGPTYVKEALIRLFKPERPIAADLHIFDIAASKTPEQTISMLITQTDALFKTLPLADIQFILFQLELFLRQASEGQTKPERKELYDTILKKIFAAFKTEVLEPFNLKSTLTAWFEKNKTEQITECFVELFHLFTQSRGFRDLQNKTLNSLEDIALMYAAQPALMSNTVLEAERRVFLRINGNKTLIETDADDFVFAVFNKEAVSELELTGLTFDKERQFRFTYRFFRTLNSFLQSRGIATSFTEASKKQEVITFTKSRFSTYYATCSSFINEACKKHGLSGLPASNIKAVRKAFRQHQRSKYRQLYGGRNVGIAVFMLTATALALLLTHHINIDHNFRFRLGQISRTFLFQSSPPSPVESYEPTPTNTFATYKVTANELHVRSGPGTKYKSLGKVRKHALIEVTDTSNPSWYKINYGNNTGYVYATYVTPQ